MAKQTLNSNEVLVFLACCEDARLNGYDFGYADGLAVEGLSKHQIAGYISSLVSKDAVRIVDDEYRQMVIHPDFAAAVGIDEKDVEHLRWLGYFTEDDRAEVGIV